MARAPMKDILNSIIINCTLMLTKKLWSQKTDSVYNGVLIFSIAGMIHSALSMFSIAEGGRSAYAWYLLQSGLSPSEIDGIAITDKFAVAAIIIGGLLLLNGLNGFASILNDQDGRSMRNLRNGIVVSIIATALAFIPGMTGWTLSGFVNFIAVILMLLAYKELKNSLSFPPQAAGGAKTLFTAQILLLIGFIPGLGMILSIVAYILVLVGWSSIKNANPETGMAQHQEDLPV